MPTDPISQAAEQSHAAHVEREARRVTTSAAFEQFVVGLATDHPGWTLRDLLRHLLDADLAEPGEIIGAGVARLVAWMDAGHQRAVELATARQAAVAGHALDQVRRRLAGHLPDPVAGAIVDQAAADLQLPTFDPDTGAALVRDLIAALRQRRDWARSDQQRTHTPDTKPVYGAKAEAYATAIELVRKAASDHGLPVPDDGREHG